MLPRLISRTSFFSRPRERREYCVEETQVRRGVTKQQMAVDSEGFVHVPEGPGLGVDLDEDTIDNLRVK